MAKSKKAKPLAKTASAQEYEGFLATYTNISPDLSSGSPILVALDPEPLHHPDPYRPSTESPIGFPRHPMCLDPRLISGPSSDYGEEIYPRDDPKGKRKRSCSEERPMDSLTERQRLARPDDPYLRDPHDVASEFTSPDYFMPHNNTVLRSAESARVTTTSTRCIGTVFNPVPPNRRRKRKQVDSKPEAEPTTSSRTGRTIRLPEPIPPPFIFPPESSIGPPADAQSLGRSDSFRTLWANATDGADTLGTPEVFIPSPKPDLEYPDSLRLPPVKHDEDSLTEEDEPCERVGLRYGPIVEEDRVTEPATPSAHGEEDAEVDEYLIGRNRKRKQADRDDDSDLHPPKRMRRLRHFESPEPYISSPRIEAEYLHSLGHSASRYDELSTRAVHRPLAPSVTARGRSLSHPPIATLSNIRPATALCTPAPSPPEGEDGPTLRPTAATKGRGKARAKKAPPIEFVSPRAALRPAAPSPTRGKDAKPRTRSTAGTRGKAKPCPKSKDLEVPPITTISDVPPIAMCNPSPPSTEGEETAPVKRSTAGYKRQGKPLAKSAKKFKGEDNVSEYAEKPPKHRRGEFEEGSSRPRKQARDDDLDDESYVDEPVTRGSSKRAPGRARASKFKNSDPDKERFYCDEPGCRASFSRAHDVKRHRDVKHTHGQCTVKCPMCKKVISRQDALKRHQESNACVPK
ncbi:hypothetical protein B0H15DRAFT_465378 [Mycena belliarum]|uniref:C2H2-type domain-containing protein n=1 Tax=Mycena belliarum TaxID=1033014 RepID=A0AAD6UES8_9AGAR|nr:hypothetical protein B0H15DRAFT_465378 [Mycena belliae]